MTKVEFAERYFQWLASQVVIERRANAYPRTYEGLLKHLHDKVFIWVVPNDDNRVGDALELRREFWGEGNQYPKDKISVLEVFIAISRRLEFIAEGEAVIWAGQLLKNLELQKMHDPYSIRKQIKTEDIIENFIWRTYERNGTGGLFPLTNPKEDQTKVEIWYQLNAYVIEHTIT